MRVFVVQWVIAQRMLWKRIRQASDDVVDVGRCWAGLLADDEPGQYGAVMGDCVERI